jgi:hypothetical protein
MPITISPWQRLVLSVAALATLTYAARGWIVGEAFFLKGVVGMIFLIGALTPPAKGSAHFPLKRRSAVVMLGLLAILGSASVIAQTLKDLSDSRKADSQQSQYEYEMSQRMMSARVEQEGIKNKCLTEADEKYGPANKGADPFKYAEASKKCLDGAQFTTGNAFEDAQALRSAQIMAGQVEMHPVQANTP